MVSKECVEGVRRYQPYPDSYKGDGKFLGDELRNASKQRLKVSREATLAARNYRSANYKQLLIKGANYVTIRKN